MEDNKLIAIFMGGEYKTVYNGIENTSCQRFYMPENHITEPITDFEYLDYHKSWDMLMHVVKNIKSNRTNPEHTFISVAFGKLNLALMEAEITPVYKEVVNIIKWYNQNK